MTKLNKIAALVATMTVAGAAFAQYVDYWRAFYVPFVMDGSI